MAAWYCIYARPKMEDTAFTNLIIRGFEVFYPREQVETRVNNRRRQIVERPFMSRYLFAGVTDGACTTKGHPLTVGHAYNVMGVVTIVHSLGGPIAIPEAVIDELRGRFDERGVLIVPKEQKQEFRVGQQVRIGGAGQLAGMVAVIERLGAKNARAWLRDSKLRVVVRREDISEHLAA